MFALATAVSQICYGITLWGAVLPLPSFLTDNNFQIGHKNSLSKVERALNHVARTIIDYHGYYQHLDIKTLYKKANILSLNQMIAKFSLAEMWSIQNTRLPVMHSKLCKLEETNYATRAGPRIKTDINFEHYNSFFHRSKHLWNMLPKEIRTISNKQTSKKHINNWVKTSISLQFE